MGDVFTSPSGYWQAGIDITEGRSASTGQYVVLTGTLQHLLAPGSPSPSNPGSIIDFTFFLRGIDGPVLSESTDWIVVSHPVPASFSDADVGHAFINGGSDPSSGEITIFSLDMEAFHTTTPEPSTWLLVGTGMLGVAWWSRRRRQVTIR